MKPALPRYACSVWCDSLTPMPGSHCDKGLECKGLTVHVLHHGVALCGLAGPPINWPPLHRWVYWDEPDLANCEACKSHRTEAAHV